MCYFLCLCASWFCPESNFWAGPLKSNMKIKTMLLLSGPAAASVLFDLTCQVLWTREQEEEEQDKDESLILRNTKEYFGILRNT